MITIKRVYEPAEKNDGFRILVDRLWPRGLSKEKARVAMWLKDIGPSDGLRKWFHHEKGSWEQFEKKYKDELKTKREFILQIKELEKQHQRVTLLYGAKDTEHNQAKVLLELLQ